MLHTKWLSSPSKIRRGNSHGLQTEHGQNTETPFTSAQATLLVTIFGTKCIINHQMFQSTSELYFCLNMSDVLLGFLPYVPKGYFNLTSLLLFMIINMTSIVHSAPYRLLSCGCILPWQKL